MIPRLNQSSLAFQAKEAISPREAYNYVIDKNSQTAQKQNNICENSGFCFNGQIPMQGTGQKLDVIA